MNTINKSIIKDIIAERNRQDKLHPKNNLSYAMWLACIVEEVGEVAKAINEHNIVEIETELIQVSSLCIRVLQQMRSHKT